MHSNMINTNLLPCSRPLRPTLNNTTAVASPVTSDCHGAANIDQLVGKYVPHTLVESHRRTMATYPIL